MTNNAVLAFGVFLEDETFENGPLIVIPESYKGPIRNYYSNVTFSGVIDPTDPNFKIKNAVPLTGKAADMIVYHARALRGSAPNRSEKNTFIRFHECHAVDAWSLLGAGSYIHSIDHEKFWLILVSDLLAVIFQFFQEWLTSQFQFCCLHLRGINLYSKLKDPQG